MLPALCLYPFNSRETELELCSLSCLGKRHPSGCRAVPLGKEPVPVFPRNCHSLSSKRS